MMKSMLLKSSVNDHYNGLDYLFTVHGLTSCSYFEYVINGDAN